MCALSTERSVILGEVARRGADGAYRRLQTDVGEARIVRRELASQGASMGPSRSLFRFAHITDLHVVDTDSPGRFEFMERYYDASDQLSLLLPAHRPQEMLTIHALEMMIRTVNSSGVSEETGAPLQLLLNTGDSTDSCQCNELRWFLNVMQGHEVHPTSGSAVYEGVQSPGWDDPTYWIPDSVSDIYKDRWGFPTHPGLLADAVASFQSQGCTVPWFSCFGNHDSLVIGTMPGGPAYEALVTGGAKPALLSSGVNELLPSLKTDPLALLAGPAGDPMMFLTGPSKPVTPSDERCSFSRIEFVQQCFRATVAPAGHGFEDTTPHHGFATFVSDDFPQVRVIGLDTVNDLGHYDGSVGARQMEWLERRLIEVHSRFYRSDGREERTANEDRLVVLASHHGSETLTNGFLGMSNANRESMDLPRVLAPGLLELLWRFPNVVLWLNGHVHQNRIQPHPDPRGRTGGFWEITTSSLIDWPCEGRMIEIVANSNGAISILATMFSHDAPVDPRDAVGIERLASLHRELAANDPHAGYRSGRHGRPEDRTVELVLPERNIDSP